MIKKIALLLLCACMLLCGAGCKQRQDDRTGDGYITITDALSRQVTVKRSPGRVAALIGSFADVWTLAGGRICATSEDAWEDFSLELDGAVNIGGAHSPSLELLLSSEPELVIASASTASNVALCEPLERMGIPVLYFDVDNFEDYLEMLRVCTTLTGRADLYQQNGVRIRERVEAIKERFCGLGLSEAERRVLVLRVSSTAVKAKGSSSTILGEMLADLGLVNVADSKDSKLEDLSVESVISLRPHHIFVVTMGDESASEQNLRRAILENSVWQSVDAVREGRLHLMDRRLFNLKPNLKWADSYEKIYSIMLGEE